MNTTGLGHTAFQNNNQELVILNITRRFIPGHQVQLNRFLFQHLSNKQCAYQSNPAKSQLGILIL